MKLPHLFTSLHFTTQTNVCVGGKGRGRGAGSAVDLGVCDDDAAAAAVQSGILATTVSSSDGSAPSAPQLRPSSPPPRLACQSAYLFVSFLSDSGAE